MTWVDFKAYYPNPPGKLRPHQPHPEVLLIPKFCQILNPRCRLLCSDVWETQSWHSRPWLLCTAGTTTTRPRRPPLPEYETPSIIYSLYGEQPFIFPGKFELHQGPLFIPLFPLRASRLASPMMTYCTNIKHPDNDAHKHVFF